MNRHFSKEHIQMPTGTWKDAQQHLSSGKHKSKPQWTTSNLSEWLLSKTQQVTTECGTTRMCREVHF